jgi:hypothetical protein
MSQQHIPRALAGKFLEWESNYGNLSIHIRNRRDQISHELSTDDKFKTLICDFVSTISDQQQKDNLSAIIRIARQLTPIPKISLADVEVDILITIILDICGRKKEAENFLIKSAWVSSLAWQFI